MSLLRLALWLRLPALHRAVESARRYLGMPQGRSPPRVAAAIPILGRGCPACGFFLLAWTGPRVCAPILHPAEGTFCAANTAADAAVRTIGWWKRRRVNVVAASFQAFQSFQKINALFE